MVSKFKLVPVIKDLKEPEATTEMGPLRPRNPRGQNTGVVDPPFPIELTVATAWQCGATICKRSSTFAISPQATQIELYRHLREAQGRLKDMALHRCPECPSLK